MKGDRLDDAARAGWLYYVAGDTQDQIAAKLGVSRQSAQRLVSLAMSAGLVRVRIEHPIANCMDLAERLRDRYALQVCDVTPTDPDAPSATTGVAVSAAVEMAKWLRREAPLVMGVGTGRTLRAAVRQLPAIECAQHKVVSLTGNIAPDGSAAFFNVIFTMSDAVKAPSFPMPLPVVASSVEERDTLLAQPLIRSTHALAAEAEVNFVGVGEFDENAPLVVDGFVSPEEIAAMRQAGAVGEICGWAFDAEGGLLKGLINDRVASAPIPPATPSLVIGVANGPRKHAAILAALSGGMLNGLITDEWTAEAILSDSD
ncbi:MAG: sugar-binding transcriptional regulator [Rhodobacteraceae bacterium]|nr:sugar-binding transcriptional regulator [Paracoccaceae bacterium]